MVINYSGKMTCGEIHSWTFSGLVGAFLDLGIAYLLLCASTLAYLASKFLGLFGLCLPCPCKGLFWNPCGGLCLQRALVNCPPVKISSVQLSVKSKFPFDQTWADDPNSQSNTESVDKRNRDNRHVEMDGEASCSSLLQGAQDNVGRELEESNESGFEFGTVNLEAIKGGRFDFKRKGAAGQRKRLGLRRRHRGRVVDNGNSWAGSSYDHSSLDAKESSQTPSSACKIGTRITEEGSSDPMNSGDGWEAPVPVDICLQGGVSQCPDLNESVYDVKSVEEVASPGEQFRCNTQMELRFDSNDKNTIRILEQSLEEENAARAALYLELEKERCAAATAADEAMAMILRLQEEKALIEMEAKQFHRMIEEKYAYDAEEMNILKEILLRREREKHFLEKEVEAYRQMMFGNDQLDADMEATETHGISSLSLSSEDPMLMLQQISKSIQDKENLKTTSSSREYEVSLNLQNHTIAFGKELPYPALNEDADFSKQGDILRQPSIDNRPSFLSCEAFHEKGTASRDEDPLTQQRELHKSEAHSQLTQSSTPQGFDLHVRSVNPVEEGQEQSDNVSLAQSVATKTIKSCDEDKTVSAYNGNCVEMDGNQEVKVSQSSVCETESRVYDVHVIDDESSMINEASEKKSGQFSRNASLNRHRKHGSPILSSSETYLEINRIRSDTTSGLPPKVPSRSKSLVSRMRRNSMSAFDVQRHSMSSFDNERLKIDNEVEWLQERLRIVQEGRGKLNFSLGNKEREKIQLQLLEDITSQLREIRQLTEPGKAVRQASLPPPSSKVTSKKRCWRSTSLGVR
ncbi:hypothetical protein I3760_01G116500 [Carya illinoinensis]|nr:hypothetical protein I3760_01G116500 [Carya illinoinensis]KAG2726519.1 hypothetical protein I3760_01G116500 [Carya illinoinensis]KAG2726520.1 hypothetical protein I3760_01G116500 [Carya illinoinensis]KAG2726522.1 hypothetical protein I3760_01G116500 [Carya illinoinensis]